MNPPLMNLDFAAVAPVAIVGIGAMAVLVLEVFLAKSRSLSEFHVSSALALVATVALGMAIGTAAQAFFQGWSTVFNPDNPMLRLDRFSSFATLLVGIGALLSVWLSIQYLIELKINHGEYYALLLISTAGMMLMVSAVDLITVFLGLEILSIPLYVLAGFDRRKLNSNESAMKYFLIGSFASGLLLYGMALLYGTTGHTDLEGIRAAFSTDNPLSVAGLGLIVVGLAFKVSAVPFHQWTPDVYEGAPTSITAFMSVTVKAAAFVTLLRFVGGSAVPENLTQVFWVLAALTIIVGSVTAVVQDNVKRMLAYSSIGHAGIILLGFVAGSHEAHSAVLFYLFAYLFMNLGAFGVMVALADRGRDWDHIEDFAGLARKRPGMAALMTLFMLSLAGIPGTVGFIAKFQIFATTVQAGYIPLTVIAVLGSVISVYYYLRLPVWMYMREPGDVVPRSGIDTTEGIVLVACAFAVVLFGLFPNGGFPVWLLQDASALSWAREAAAALR
ncbi:MAG: NADH-quinone oxidoreductase subunit N [Deltaproteobacteria bacterium]|nr:NADH-quinone oxidoreductase subunit N [Deltaproteobacteria bacterium]MBW2373588.1 NADH-quinone oxidoreductase subunit N [Deltaproteobacteria bacterium]